ncbi:OLC1v1032843C1 [Oldenlandia corymbosa var. corymbosa]|uniref:OLC1v1032843C1 n=1 Tax=Oldenlandia corymbosa var. corymbosa TaxID=529605 RepID=A0AAV1CMU8_OLDCO|nr:OLC1v1032843C1 [Oldenlandia corymbosa var. corymbosa]
MTGNLVLCPLASYNGSPYLSFTTQCHSVSCGDVELAKLVSTSRLRNTEGMICCLKKGDSNHQKIHQDGRFTRGNSSQAFRLRTWETSATSLVETAEELFCYRFRTETNDQLKVLVEKKNYKYNVQVKFVTLQFSVRESELVMCWGLFRCDSSCDLQGSSWDDRNCTTELPFKQETSGTLSVELDFDLSAAPFYISFLLKSRVNSDMKSPYIRSHRKTRFVVPVGFSSGHPVPLGLSYSAGHLNLALFSRSAERVILCLYDSLKTDKPALEIDLDPYVNKSGDIWHVAVDGTTPFVKYGYRCNLGMDSEQDNVLLDPYAKAIHHLSGSSVTCLGELHEEPPFDWGEEVRPCLPMEQLIVYRLNVMCFTRDNSSKLTNDIKGTFSAVAEKAHHFKKLGVNAILLEPIFSFDDQKGPYLPWHFFSAASQYGETASMKKMVKELHNNGIEVFLEVVFTHTAENAALRVIDQSSYYYNVEKKDDNLTRTINALNCNHPVVSQMILDSLRHWVTEFRVDGFCFMNAASLLRGFHGEVLTRPPLVEAIAFDPILSKTKIIADCWDPFGMKPKDISFPHWKKWAEVNSKFCFDVRNFLRGEGLLSNLATRLCGSGDAFLDGRGPAFSFNFIARNFGLSLVDLVSFSDNATTELSWNCGEEGPTDKVSVLETRVKQIRNFLFILFMSLGVPVLNMGDECGQSSGGSPAYADKNNHFDWNALRTGFGTQTVEFISFLSSLRKRRSDLLQRKNFLQVDRIQWHGSNQSVPKWDDEQSQYLAVTLKSNAEVSKSGYGDLFAAFNAAEGSETIVLPPPPADFMWFRLVDTALPFPGFFTADGAPVEDELLKYEIQSHSCALFEARRQP